MNLTKITQEIEDLEYQLAEIKVNKELAALNCACPCTPEDFNPEYDGDIAEIEKELDEKYAHMDELLGIHAHS